MKTVPQNTFLCLSFLTLLNSDAFALGERVRSEPEKTPTTLDRAKSWSKFNWAKTSERDFDLASVPAPFRTHGRYSVEYPTDDPVEVATMRSLQYWADDIHSIVSDELQNYSIPRPIIRLHESKTANAWASSIPVCLNARVYLDFDEYSETTIGGTGEENFILFPDSIRTRFLGLIGTGRKIDCVQTTWSNDIHEFVDWFNSQNGSCQLTISEDSDQIFLSSRKSKDCDTSRLGRASFGNNIVVYASSPFLNMTSAMVAMADSPESILATISHEMAHYYFNHTFYSFTPEHYGYWYKGVSTRDFSRPQPIADSEDFNAEIDFVAPVPHPVLTQTVYDYRLYQVIISLTRSFPLPSICEGSKCQACEEAMTMAYQEWFNEADCFACSYLDPNVEASLIRFEERFSECAKNLSIVVDETQKGVPVRELRGFLKSKNLPKYLSFDVSPGNLDLFLKQVSAELAPIEKRRTAIFERIRSTPLENYTAEQEADEFSMEFSFRAGLPDDRLIDSIWDLIMERAAKDPTAFYYRNHQTVDECEAIKQAGWNSYIPMGGLNQNHHGDCFRIYNRNRMLSATKNARPETKTPGYPLADGLTWKEIQSFARKITDAIKDRPPRPFMSLSNQPIYDYEDEELPIFIEFDKEERKSNQ